MSLKEMTQQPYHALSVTDVFNHVHSSPKGLSDFECAGRRQVYGRNELPTDDQFSWVKLLWQQFANPLIVIIALAATVSFILGHHVDAIFIVIVIAINAFVGFLQEFKAHNALEALRGTMRPTARVVRSGASKVIDAAEIVVGDVVELRAGDHIPADGRLFAMEELFVNESVLTGEWIDVQKDESLSDVKAHIGERHAMVFAGAHVTSGEGRFVVTAVGHMTEVGQIAAMVRDEDDIEEPLKKKFITFSRRIGLAVMILIAIFAFFGVMRGQTLAEIFVTATALIVSAIPEGLLPAVTIVMIFGVRRLVRKKALVRRLSATETIGAITVICTDKTGTLTEGNMRVSHVLTGAQELLEHIAPQGTDVVPRISSGHLRALEIGGIVNDAFIENPQQALEHWTIQGRPTDRALLLAAVQAGIDVPQITSQQERIGHVPFSSARKFAAHIYAHKGNKNASLLALGAPERILDLATHVDLGNDVHVSLSQNVRTELEGHIDALTRKGLRVVACAERSVKRRAVTDHHAATALVEKLTLVGFIAIKDPVRTDAKKAIKRAERAGIRPIIITGDHAQTAAAIVSELDWYVPSEHILVGADVEEMSDEQLQTAVKTTALFARVAPRHKIRIVHALQENDEVVAMVGDGVNDAPALKAAHVGISMGNGTDITKGVADIVLLDSSFTTIIDAIEQGRVIFDNIRRIVTYLLADDFSEIFIFFVALLFGLPLPLVAAQILWINLIEDSLPNIALTTERDTKGIMDVPPRKSDEPIITAVYKRFMFVIFAVSGISAAFLFTSVLHFTEDVALSQTMTFVLIAFDSLAMVYILRSFRRSIFRRDIFSNHMINGAVLTSLFLLVAAVTFEPLMGILRTVPIDLSQWGIIVAITVGEVIVLEIAKRYFFFAKKSC